MESNVIDNILKQNGYMSLETIKEKTGIYDERKLVNLLLQHFQKELLTSFERKENDPIHLLKCFKYINQLIACKCKVNSKTFQLLDKISVILDNSEWEDSLFVKEAKLHLKNVSDNLFYRMNKRFQKDRYGLVECLLFDIKSPLFVSQFFDRLPQFVNLEDAQGRKVIENVVQAFMKELYLYMKDSNRLANIAYYDAVLDIIQCSKEFKMDDDLLSKLLQDINSFRETVNEEALSSRQRSLFQLWLVNLKNRLLDKNYVPKTLEEVNELYRIDPVGFKESVIKELQEYSKRVTFEQFPNRVVVDDVIVTIDPIDVGEIDDGISVKKLENGNYLLGVHIANPRGYFPEGSEMIKEAIRRGCSLYFDSSPTINSFPRIVVKEQMSLEEGQPRLATSYYMEVNSYGEIENYQFVKSIIRSKKKLNYEEVSDCLQGSKVLEDPEIMDVVIHFSECCTALEKKFKPEKALDSKRRKVTYSEKMIELAMVATGSTVATHFFQRNYPFLYRVHNLDGYVLFRINMMKEAIEKIDSEYEKSKLLKAIHVLESSFPATYSTVNTGHDNLNLPAYSHVTSPLRRGADLVNEEPMDLLYFNPTPEDKDVYQLEEKLKGYEKSLKLQLQINDRYSVWHERVIRN